MTASLLLTLLISEINPSPILLQSLIDAYRIIGLPRLRTMDKLFAAKVWIGTFGDEAQYFSYSRKKFLIGYINLRGGS
jgi:hypothetical protein